MQTASTHFCDRMKEWVTLSTVIGCHLCKSSREISLLLNMSQPTVSGILTELHGMAPSKAMAGEQIPWVIRFFKVTPSFAIMQLYTFLVFSQAA